LQEVREIMATVEKVPMLPGGHEALLVQLRNLKEVERPAVVEAIEEARAHGDLSENAEYHAAKERQGQIEAQVIELEDMLARAIVIDPKTLSGDKVVFGATVHLLDEDDKPVTYQIVGQHEANAREGRISFSSPLGKALIGRRIQDEVEVHTPSGDKYYQIERIEFI
jgi:transcription elongation factor GreA